MSECHRRRLLLRACLLLSCQSLPSLAARIRRAAPPEDAAARAELVDKVKISPYRYASYASVVGHLTADELKLGGPEINKTPDAVAQAASESLQRHAPDCLPHLDEALRCERLVNRGLVLEDEIRSGRYFATMSMMRQSVALAVFLAGLHAGPAAGLKILVAGCGVGDWAAEVALRVDSTSTVWCWNYGAFSHGLGRRIFQGNAPEDVFDLSLMDAEEQEAAVAIHAGSKLRYVCSEPGNAACQGQPAGGLLTSQIAESVAAFGAGPGYDGVLYGNALTPEELAGVRASLRGEASFALVPVCLSMWASHDELAAAWYCEGTYWKIGKHEDEGPLMTFPGVMRPIASPSAAGPTAGAARYTPEGWAPKK